MTRVKVRYFGLFGKLAGKEKEETFADSLGELIDKIASKYAIKEYFHERVGSDPGLILTYNGAIITAKDYGMKLKDEDEIMFMSIISGG